MTLRDALDPELRGDTLRVAFRSGPGGMQVVESDARHIDRGRRKDVGISDDRLVGFIGLIALLEAAAVRYTAKDAGDELGIIRVAEAAEYLIFRGRVEIDANVKGVLMFEELGAVGVVVGKATGCGDRVQIQQLDGVWIQTAGRKLIQAAGSERIDGCACSAGSERVANKACLLSLRGRKQDRLALAVTARVVAGSRTVP